MRLRLHVAVLAAAIAIFTTTAHAASSRYALAVVRNGDVWLYQVHNTHISSRRLTTIGQVERIAVDFGQVAMLRHGQVYAVRISTGGVRKISDEHGFFSVAWVTPTELALGRGLTTGVDGDDGLWLCDLETRKFRRLTKPFASDVSVDDLVAVSPHHKLVAAGGGVSASMMLSVVDVARWREVYRTRDTDPPAALDFAWRDDHTLLIGMTPTNYGVDPVRGGIWQLDVPTGHLSQWKYARPVSVFQMIRLSNRWLGVGRAEQGASSVGKTKYEIVDLMTRRATPLKIPGSAVISGMTADGRKLVIWSPGQDLDLLDWKSGGSMTLAKNVTAVAVVD